MTCTLNGFIFRPGIEESGGISVAAGILPAVEPGVPPGGKKLRKTGKWPRWPTPPGRWSGRRDAALHGRRDARRYILTRCG